MSNPFLAGSWREAMQKVSRTIDQSFGELAILTRCDRRVQRMVAARKIASVKLGKRPNMPAEPDPSMGVFSYRSNITVAFMADF